VGVGIVLVVLVSFLVFASTQVLPGDAASAILGRGATPQAKRLLRQELGLDRSIPAQYWSWSTGLVRGDLGRTLAADEPVTTFLSGRVGNTLILAAVTIVLMIPLSLFFGVWAGIRRGRAADHVISGASLAAIALPEFVIGTVLVALFAVSLKWLPAVSVVPSGANPITDPTILVLPVATLLLVSLAFNIRMVRAGVAEAMSSDYVRMARLNGIPEARVIRRHVLRNALAPTVQVIGLTVLWLVGGVVVVETVFAYPGIGQALVGAVSARDIPVVQAITMLVAALYIVINVITDVIVVLLIPKLRTQA
jgi:peptide/nickel transport system permease protein